MTATFCVFQRLNVEIYAHLNWSGGYNAFFLLNSAKHEILNAHNYKKKTTEIKLFSGSDKPRIIFSCS